MAGLAVTKDSNGSGTTPLDIRLTNRALYGAGGVVEEHPLELSATDLTVTVPEQIALCSRSAAYGSVWVHVPRTAIQVTATSAPRYATLWVEQHDVGSGDVDSKPLVGVSYGAALPSLSAGRTAVGSLLVPANATRSTQCTPTGDKAFVVPSGGTLGILHQWTDPANGEANQDGLDLGRGRVYLPTDRWVQMEMLICVSTNTAQGDGSGAIMVHFNMDWPSQGQIVQSYEFEYTKIWRTQYLATQPLRVPAGSHEFWYYRYKRAGQNFWHRYGDINGEHYPGTIFTVRDLGVAR